MIKSLAFDYIKGNKLLSRRSKCKTYFKATETEISFSGLDGPHVLKFKIASLQIKREVVQAATDIAQIYDQYQFSNCLKRQELPKGSPKRFALIMASDENERKLLDFLLILKLARSKLTKINEEAIANWIASNAPKEIKEKTQDVIADARSGLGPSSCT